MSKRGDAGAAAWKSV